MYTGRYRSLEDWRVPYMLSIKHSHVDYITSKFKFCLYGTNLKEDKVMMGLSIALIIIVLIVLYSLARTAGESDRILENIREQSLLGREESSGGNS